MTAFRLRLKIGKRELERLGADQFLWAPRGEQSSMATNIGPHLEDLGKVPLLHKDFVQLAVLVYLADRTAERGRGSGMRWDRDIELTVPVSDPARWGQILDELEFCLRELTGDVWSLEFEKQAGRKRAEVADVAPADAVCLFSGGADSLAGAIAIQKETGVAPVLVSHWDFNKLASVQSHLVSRLEQIWETPIEHHCIQIQRRGTQIGSGIDFPDEKSRRSRSFLFLALGLAVAAVRGSDLWICENGFTSINPPLSPERRSSLSTRTTHPGFLDHLEGALTGIGLGASIRKPFELKTKGAVLRLAAEGLTTAQAQELFGASHSCGKPPIFRGFSSGDQCGVCFGCLIRRGSFIAAGIKDESRYLETELRGASNRDDFLTPTRRKTIEAVRYRLRRSYGPADVLAMSLPERLSVDDALTVVSDGLEELRPVVEDIS